MKNDAGWKRINDWSINLEDSYYAEHPKDLLADAVAAVKETAAGVYVNLVTPGELGRPNDFFLPELTQLLQEQGVPYRRIQYMDECGCGGHVTRVYV